MKKINWKQLFEVVVEEEPIPKKCVEDEDEIDSDATYVPIGTLTVAAGSAFEAAEWSIKAYPALRKNKTTKYKSVRVRSVKLIGGVFIP